MPRKALTAAQASRALGISLDTLRRWDREGKIRVERAEMIDPKVQQQGDIAVLTFNLVSHGARFGDGPKGDVRWNSTEVYQRISGQWKIIHSHWSYTQPDLKEKPAE